MIEVNVIELVALCAAMFGIGVNATTLMFYFVMDRRLK